MARSSVSPLVAAFETTLKFIAILFAVELIDGLFGLGLDRYGIRPREVYGLRGVLFAPLLHGSFGHVAANSGPLCVLLPIFLVDRRQRPWRALGCIWLFGGLGTWLLGRGGATHIGASGVVYGIAAYLVVAGVVGSSWKATLIAVFVVLIYGGLVYGLLPKEGPISWEGHLIGALVGGWAAWRNRSRIQLPRSRTVRRT
jgi:membrane associated rhomboid family serine protease